VDILPQCKHLKRNAGSEIHGFQSSDSRFNFIQVEQPVGFCGPRETIIKVMAAALIIFKFS
jgi:hypothetical protein